MTPPTTTTFPTERSFRRATPCNTRRDRQWHAFHTQGSHHASPDKEGFQVIHGKALILNFDDYKYMSAKSESRAKLPGSIHIVTGGGDGWFLRKALPANKQRSREPFSCTGHGGNCLLGKHVVRQIGRWFFALQGELWSFREAVRLPRLGCQQFALLQRILVRLW